MDNFYDVTELSVLIMHFRFLSTLIIIACLGSIIFSTLDLLNFRDTARKLRFFFKESELTPFSIIKYPLKITQPINKYRFYLLLLLNLTFLVYFSLFFYNDLKPIDPSQPRLTTFLNTLMYLVSTMATSGYSELEISKCANKYDLFLFVAFRFMNYAIVFSSFGDSFKKIGEIDQNTKGNGTPPNSPPEGSPPYPPHPPGPINFSLKDLNKQLSILKNEHELHNLVTDLLRKRKEQENKYYNEYEKYLKKYQSYLDNIIKRNNS